MTNEITTRLSTVFSSLALAPLCACFALTFGACTDDGGQTDDAQTDGTDTEDGTETGDSGDGTDTGDTDTDTGDTTLAIVGSYTDDFADVHTITAVAWINGAGSFDISEWSNGEMWLVAQNAETNMFSPDLWSRFDWAWDGEQLYYCQSVYDGATVEDALAGGADTGDLAGVGCGGFAWSMLTPN